MINLVILEPFKTESFSAIEIEVFSAFGSFTIMQNHAPLIGSIASGDILVLKNDGEQNLSITLKEGIIHIENNLVKIFC